MPKMLRHMPAMMPLMRCHADAAELMLPFRAMTARCYAFAADAMITFHDMLDADDAIFADYFRCRHAISPHDSC